MTRRKTILSGKRAVIDGKHILTTEEIYLGVVKAENKTKKRRIEGKKKSKRIAAQVVEESNEESEASQDE